MKGKNLASFKKNLFYEFTKISKLGHDNLSCDSNGIFEGGEVSIITF